MKNECCRRLVDEGERPGWCEGRAQGELPGRPQAPPRCGTSPCGVTAERSVVQCSAVDQPAFSTVFETTNPQTDSPSVDRHSAARVTRKPQGGCRSTPAAGDLSTLFPGISLAKPFRGHQRYYETPCPETPCFRTGCFGPAAPGGHLRTGLGATVSAVMRGAEHPSLVRMALEAATPLCPARDQGLCEARETGPWGCLQSARGSSRVLDQPGLPTRLDVRERGVSGGGLHGQRGSRELHR